MTTIHVTIRGKLADLQLAIGTAIHHASTRRFTGKRLDTLVATYICETDDYDEALQATMDSIDIEKLEDLGCEVAHIG